MENLNLNLSRTKVAVSASEVKPGDTIFVKNTDNAQSYYVIDVGAPYILIENTKTHFGSFYRITDVVYKEM